jgi:hypothetical protein
MTRHEVLEMASIACLKELYSKAQPAINWDDLMEENRLYSKAYKQWESLYKESPEKAGSVLDFCGPRPYEFYYLPKEVLKEIADSYIDAYYIDSQQNLLNIIDTLKNYCLSPIKESYIKESDGETRRGYVHPDNIKKTIQSLLQAFYSNSDCDSSYVSDELVKIFFEFLDDAGGFYTWNRDLTAFNMSVYLGPSPCSNKETVIKNWKLYRNKDIKIDDSIYIEDDEWK